MFLSRSKSCKVALYLFWVAQSRANISVAQSRNLPILSRNGRSTPDLGRNGRKIPFLGRVKSQHTNFESQW